MSLGIQAQSLNPVTSEISFFEIASDEEVETNVVDVLPSEGKSKSVLKQQYVFTQKTRFPQYEKLSVTTSKCAHFINTTCVKAEMPTPMLFINFSNRPTQMLKNGPHLQQIPGQITKTKETITHSMPLSKELHLNKRHLKNIVSTRENPSHTQSQLSKSNPGSPSSTHQKKTDRQQNPLSTSVSGEWKKKETKEWWQTRYDQKERQGGQHQQDEQRQEEKKEKHVKITKTMSTASAQTSVSCQKEIDSKSKKPSLEPPKIGIFALYYILTKMGIYSDATSNFAYKKEVEWVDGETTAVHKQRLEDIKEGIKKEKEIERWGIAAKIFSWIASLTAILTGIALIATGVGAVAGAMLIAGGVLQMTSQIMEMTGGWQKIAELLPGDDFEKKRAVITWMQLGIGILCLILSAAGAIWGGIPDFKAAMQLANASINSIAMMGQAMVTIGEGVINFDFFNKMADIKKFDYRLAQLKHVRQDLMEKVELGIDRLEKLFEDLAQALEFEVELFQADQMLYRR